MFRSRSIHSDDGSLLPEEEDRLLCHPDLHALLHDRDPVTGLLLAQPGVRASADRLWLVLAKRLEVFKLAFIVAVFIYRWQANTCEVFLSAVPP